MDLCSLVTLDSGDEAIQTRAASLKKKGRNAAGSMFVDTAAAGPFPARQEQEGHHGCPGMDVPPRTKWHAASYRVISDKMQYHTASGGEPARSGAGGHARAHVNRFLFLRVAFGEPMPELLSRPS